MSRGLDGELLSEIEKRFGGLNASIAGDKSLGPQFRIGHSFVTPGETEKVVDGPAWFRAKVESEIGQQLDEIWYDSLERAQEERNKLVAGLP